MKVNGYKQNKCNSKCCNNSCYNNCNYNFCSPLNSLFEVENFLCNLKKVTKCINLYKFLK